MRKFAVLCALLLLMPFVAGCASRATPAATYNVDAAGGASAGVRSASDAQPGLTGPQEIAGLNIPLGPDFNLKGALIWSGQPWFYTPPAPAPQVAAQAVCAPQTIQVQETYTEMVPVQRTRTVERQVVTIPVPQAVAPRCVPAPAPQRACPSPPVAQGGCPGGRCCVVPAPFVIASAR